MNEVETLRAAIETIRMEPKSLREAADEIAPTIVAWLEGAADDLASALNAYPFADEECDLEELLDLCDEPDSVRHALALARVITGQDSETGDPS